MSEEDGERKAADSGGKQEGGPITVVLKLDLHCQGCAKKVKRAVSHFKGVEKVKADCDANELTVSGNVDPTALREWVEYKTKKKVELIPPQPKEDGGGDGGGDEKAEEKTEKKAEEKKADYKKPKEPTTTVVMKVKLHFEECAYKIKRVISKNIDDEDNKGGESTAAAAAAADGKKVEVNKIDDHGLNLETQSANDMPIYNQDYWVPIQHYQDYPPNHDYASTSYAVQYASGPPSPPPIYMNLNDQIFSDENPNGCSIM